MKIVFLEPLGLKTNTENTQIVETNGTALKQHLTETGLHLYQHTTDGGLGEDTVMGGHVLDELVELHHLVNGTAVPLSKGLGIAVGVFVLLESNHFVLDY